ncbi:biphenyl 2,3-dioxygenase, partial [bacterium]|nr:biphenyl 2,3-dioxygenase [bacterium]
MIKYFIDVYGLKIITFLLTILPNTVFAASTHMLKEDDLVGISFWMISMALVAATAFFFLETQRVAPKWKTSLTVSGLVTLVASVHYFYMRDVWIEVGSTPTVYRYIDWLIT